MQISDVNIGVFASVFALVLVSVCVFVCEHACVRVLSPSLAYNSRASATVVNSGISVPKSSTTRCSAFARKTLAHTLELFALRSIRPP